MFTGLVEEVGTVRRVVSAADSTHLEVVASYVREGLSPGDSVSVNGACLTVEALSSGTLTFGLAPETLRRTNLGDLTTGDRVNLERSVRVGDRLGGHYVQGHVDGLGEVVETSLEADSLLMTFEAPEALCPYIVEKGFIAIDGTSLTVTERHDRRFSIALVAYTREHVALAEKQRGARVNLEVDVIAKYVESLLTAQKTVLTR